MAVTQISKIQIRRGFQSDLGNLAAGEFGWAIDTQRLFIGNGSTEEGAPLEGITEVMTNISLSTIEQLSTDYVYKGALGGYQVSTGSSLAAPVIRALQDKIDDFVNVRDFGASGNGNLDDTAAIQRALDELYDRNSQSIDIKTRRRLRFAAGSYLIAGELQIPPYVALEGEGLNNVKLIVEAPIKLVTSNKLDPANNLADTTYPIGVSVQSMTLATLDPITLFRIDGSNDVSFQDVIFEGSLITPTSSVSDEKGVHISSTSKPTSRIQFTRCKFVNLGTAVLIDSVAGTSNIEFTNCSFENLSEGIITVFSQIPDVPPSDIKITTCKFQDIYSTVIYGDTNVSGIVSLSNSFRNCASSLEGDQTSFSVWKPVIEFNHHNNYSIADIFARTPENSKSFVRVQTYNYKTVSLSIDQFFQLGSSKYTAGNKIILPYNQGFSHRLESLIDQGIINYTMKRNTDLRTGIIKYTRSSNNIILDDEYTETNDLGVNLGIIVNPNDSTELRLAGSTDNRNNSDVIFCFDLKTLS